LPRLSEKIIGEFFSRSIGGVDESTLAKVVIAKLDDVEYGRGNVWSSYLPKILSPGIAKSLFPLESEVGDKEMVATNKLELWDVSTELTTIPATSESGIYQIETFVWDSLDDFIALAPITSTSIIVE